MRRIKRISWPEFALLRESCGLTQVDTASLLDLTLDQVRNYDSGRRECPPKTINALKKVYLLVERTARFGRPARGVIARGVARRSLEMKIVKNFKADGGEWDKP